MSDLVMNQDEFYNYISFKRLFDDNFECSVMSDEKEFVVISDRDSKDFYVIRLSWYDRTNTYKKSEGNTFPYLTQEIKVL